YTRRSTERRSHRDTAHGIRPAQPHGGQCAQQRTAHNLGERADATSGADGCGHEPRSCASGKSLIAPEAISGLAQRYCCTCTCTLPRLRSCTSAFERNTSEKLSTNTPGCGGAGSGEAVKIALTSDWRIAGVPS